MTWLTRLFRGDTEIVSYETEDTSQPTVVTPKSTKAVRKILPRFRGTASDQPRQGTKSLDKVRLKLRKAFTPSRPIMDVEMFAGRTELLEGLIRSIEDQQMHLVLFGPRGIGKTSALHILCNIARDARYLVRYISCGERTDFPELFRAVLADIPLLYHEAYDPTSEEIEEGLSFAALVSDEPLTVAILSDILAKVAGTRLLIVLDEFDRAHGPEFRRSIAELIKNLSDRNSRVQLVIAGVAQNLGEIIEHIPSIRRNIVGIQLPNMTDGEIGELITNGELESGIDFSQARQLITKLSLGLPYIASLLSQNAGLVAIERDGSAVNASDVEKAIGRVVEELELRIAPSHRYLVDRIFCNGQEREFGILARVALQNSGRLADAEIAKALGFNENTDKYLREIENTYKIICPMADAPSGVYTFVDDGVPTYFWMRLIQDKAMRSTVVVGLGE